MEAPLIFITILVLSTYLNVSVLGDEPNKYGKSGDTPRPQQNPSVVCYFTNWAQYRPDLGKFSTSDLDANLCTDIVIAFAEIDTNALTIKTREWNDEQTYAEIIALKQQNTELKIHLAIGGWNAGTAPFEYITASDARMQTFAENSAAFLRNYGFDGLDLDWEFPGTQYRTHFTRLCQILKNYFIQEAQGSRKTQLKLTAAVSAYEIETSYEPELIHPYLDNIYVMTYDFYGSWSPGLGHNSPLYVRPEDMDDPTNSLLAQNVSMVRWHNAGVPNNKLVMGIAAYGRTFIMASESQNKPGDPFTAAGDPGPYTATSGFLAYYEVCQLLSQGWTDVWMSDSRVPYAYGQRNGHWEWVGYDNVESMNEKAAYIRDNQLAGAMFWTLDFDDFRHNVCGQGVYPLISNMKNGLQVQGRGRNE